MPAATKKKPKVAQFASKGRNLRLILLPRIEFDNPTTGRTQRTQEGYTAEFSRAPFDRAPDESDGSFEWPDPKVASDEIGESGFPLYVDQLSGAEVDVVARLREHNLNGVQFTELGNEPDRPTEQLLLADISQALAAGDLERVVEIYDDEQNGEQRDSIMNAAMAAAKAIEAQAEEGS